MFIHVLKSLAGHAVDIDLKVGLIASLECDVRDVDRLFSAIVDQEAGRRCAEVGKYGVKVDRITSLQDNIKMNLEVKDIRILAPIPAKM